MTDHAHSLRLRADHHDELVPRVLLRAVAALVVAAMAIVVFATLTGRPPSSTPPVSETVRERAVILQSAASGTATVTSTDGTLVAELSPEQGGFIAGVHRVILRERTKNRVALEGPVLLRRFENGRVAVFDPSTGWGADLMGFGADNARAFARLLD